MRRVITALVNNHSGVLNRVSGVLTRRQFNIETICAGQTDEENISRITVVVQIEESNEVEQILKQLNKQIEVIKVTDITDVPHLERELALVKVNVKGTQRAEMQVLIEPFRAQIIDVSMHSIVVQVTGTNEKVDAFVDVLRPFGIQEVARTGLIGLTRSKK